MKIRFVSLRAFESLWARYVQRARTIHFSHIDKSLRSIWNYEDKCFWAIHPEESLW